MERAVLNGAVNAAGGLYPGRSTANGVPTRRWKRRLLPFARLLLLSRVVPTVSDGAWALAGISLRASQREVR
jgi:hypothetical protein